MNPIKKIEEMSQEAQIVNNIKASKYGARVVGNLLSYSVAKNYTEAVKEWEWTGTEEALLDIECALCGHKHLVKVCKLENKKNLNKMLVGSKCVEQFAWIEVPAGKTRKAYVTKRLKGYVELRRLRDFYLEHANLEQKIEVEKAKLGQPMLTAKGIESDIKIGKKIAPVRIKRFMESD